MRRLRTPALALTLLTLAGCAGQDRLVFAPVVIEGMYAADPLAGSFLRAQGRVAPRLQPAPRPRQVLLSSPCDGPSPD